VRGARARTFPARTDPTRWPTDFDGRFLGYNSKIRSIYVQPTVGYQLHEKVKVGVGLAYIYSDLELHQRLDLSAQAVPGFPGTTFYNLGIPYGTDFADANLSASGSGFALNFGAIVQLTDRLSIGGRWITRKTITYDGDAVFDQLATGLTLPAGNPLGAPAGTSMDLVVAGQFAPTGALADGAVGTAITLPPQGNIGLAFEATDNLTILADYQLVVWGWFDALDIDFERYPGDVAADFTLYEGYRDTHGIRVGAEYRPSDRITVRAGVLHHSGAAPDETVTPLLPEGKRNEFTLGFTGHLTPSLVADFAYQYVKQNDRRGRIHDPSVGNTGVYAFGAHLFGVGLSLTF
jgi:long-chain fatty acid transport protein